MPRRYMVEMVAVLSCLGCSLLVAGDPPPTSAPANKVQFSDPGDGFQVPVREEDKKLFPKTFEFLDRQSSVSGVISPSLVPAARVLPSASANPRLLETFERRLDEKKNWVYKRAGDAESQPTLEEMFGIRASNGDKKDRRGRSIVADFFESSGKPPSSTHRFDSSLDGLDKNLSSKDYDKRSVFGGGFETAGKLRGETALEPFGSARGGFSVETEFAAPQPDAMRPSDALDPSFRDFRAQDRSQDVRSDDFKRLLASPSGVNPLGTAFDPINLQSDTTRQQMNPITPIGLDNRFIGPGLSTETFSSESAATTGSRSGALTDSSATTLGSSSLAPAVSTSFTPQRVQAQPVSLELPKRRF